MDGASIVGLIASVIGIATAVAQVYQRVKMLEEKAGSVPEVFETVYTNLPVLSQGLKDFSNHIEEEQPSLEVLEASENLIKRLETLLARLREELEVLILTDQDPRGVRIRKAWKSLRYEGEAGEIWKQICECRNSLTFNRVVAWDSARRKGQWVPPILHIPRGREVEFVGRQQILADIADILSTVGSPIPPTLVLRGMGGQGKTQLALQFCIQNRERGDTRGGKPKKYRAIFWVDAATETAARRGFFQIYDVIKTPETNIEDDDAKIQHVIKTIQAWTFPWLLVFDNYDNPSAFPSLRQLMPISQEGGVLVTSRHEDSAYVGKVLEVPPLQRDEAVEILLQHVRQREDTSSPDAAALVEEIVLKLGCHALAVHQAGCFISKNCAALSEFLPLYNTAAKLVLSWKPAIWSYGKPSPEDHTQQVALSVYATFELAFDALPYEDDTARKVRKFLDVCSHLAINRISDALFLASMSDDIPALDVFRNPDGTWNQAEFRTITGGLRDCGLLLSSTPYGRSFAIHPLISEWLKVPKDTSEEALKAGQACDAIIAAKIVRNCLESLVQDLPHRYLDLPLDIRQEILPHVMACEGAVRQSLDSQDALEVHRICEAFAEFLDSCGNYDTAERLQESAIKALRSGTNTATGKLTASIGLLSRIYHHKGMFARAEEILRERLGVVDYSLENGNQTALALAEMLTTTLCYQGKINEAEAFAERILEIRNQYQPDKKRELLECRASLAWILLHNNKIEKARKMEEEVLEERMMRFGADDLDTLTSYNAQGCLWLAQGKLDASERVLRKAVEGRTKRLGPTHPSTLNALTNLSMVLASQERWEDAISKSQEVLQARETQLGSNHIATLVSVANLLEVLKYTPNGPFPQGEVDQLQIRLDEAAKEGLWERAKSGYGDNPGGVIHPAAAMSGKRRFEYRKLMERVGSIWRPRPIRTQEEIRIFQSQEQKQQ